MNYRVFELLNGWAGRADPIDDLMVGAATWLIYAVFAVGAMLVVRALRRRRWTNVAAAGATLLLAFLGSAVLQQLSTEVRPFQTHAVHQLIPHAAGASLPSDHATASFAIAFAVMVFLDRRWGLALTITAAVIGLARIWVGVHYPGDIQAAALIAALATLEVRTGWLWLWHTGRAPTTRPPLRVAR